MLAHRPAVAVALPGSRPAVVLNSTQLEALARPVLAGAADTTREAIGRGSLAGLMPYGNANTIVKEMACEVLTAVRHTPVLAGVCATDPFLIRDHFLRELRDMGFAGIQNFPTVGLIDGVFRANLEETGMGFALEIDCIAAAHELDLLTTPYAFDTEQSRLLAEAGADIVVAHMGLTTKGSIGAQHRSNRPESANSASSSRLSQRTSTRYVEGRSTSCAGMYLLLGGVMRV